MSDCDPLEYSPPGSSVHGLILARILEWVATSLGDFPDLGVETRSATFQADSLPPESQGKPTP